MSKILSLRVDPSCKLKTTRFIGVRSRISTDEEEFYIIFGID